MIPSHSERLPGRHRARPALLRFALSYAASLWFCACGGTEPRAEHAPAARALVTDRPAELLPAAGLRWLVRAKPRILLENEAFRDAIEALAPATRRSAFASRIGVRLEDAEDAVIAGYDLATVYGASLRTPEARRALTLFREHLRGGGELVEAAPELSRVTGIAGEIPEALVRVGERTVIVARGDVTVARVVEAFALGKLRRSPAALRGAALSRLPEARRDTLAILYVPGPFEGEWSRAALGLLGVTEALSVSLSPGRARSLRVHLDAIGEFPNDAAERLKATIEAVVASPTGSVLGLNHPIESPTVRVFPGRLELDVTLESAPIAAGLRAAVSAEVSEILNLPTVIPQ